MPGAPTTAPPPRTAFGPRHRLALLAAFTILYLTATCLLAARAPLWYDELFTYHLARLPRLADLWPALAAGTDGNPPVYHLLTRLCQQVFGAGELATRLPAVVGYWVMSVCLYHFVARRCRPACAVVAMLFPLATAAYQRWAYNARPYGFLLGCCGLALVCWQAAAEGQRRRLALPGLALSLALACASHYYACLFLLPFAAGELARARVRRRADLPMWLALAAGPAALAAVLPLALGARKGMAPFGFAPGWTAIGETYWFLLRYARWPVLAALALAALYPRRGPGRKGRALTPPEHEVVAAVALAALPVVGVCLGQWVAGYFAPRYVLPAVLGWAILLAFILQRRTGGSLPLALALALIFLGRFFQSVWHEYREFGQERAGISQACDFLGRHGGADLPVAVADPFTFLQLAHYAPGTLRPRLVYLSHLEAARRRNPTDPRDWCLCRLRQWAGVPVRDYAPFLAAHPRFLLYGEGGWLRPTLVADGFRCRPCAACPGSTLFEAEARVPPRRAEER